MQIYSSITLGLSSHMKIIDMFDVSRPSSLLVALGFRDSNCEIFSPKQYAAPAATIQAFVNGAIGSRLPSHSR